MSRDDLLKHAGHWAINDDVAQYADFGESVRKAALVEAAKLVCSKCRDGEKVFVFTTAAWHKTGSSETTVCSAAPIWQEIERIKE